MPKTAKKTTLKAIKPLRSVTSENTPALPTSVSPKSPYPFLVKLLFVVIFGTLLYFLALKYRGLFLAGTINSSPISRMELNAKMAERYGKQAFEEIVSEKLLATEIKKNNIVVSDDEVKTEIDKLIKQYGGEEAYKNALVQFNMTEEKAKESIKQSLAFKKLVEKNNKIEITVEAIKKYFDENKTSFVGKKLEEVSESIKDSLYQQELFTKSQELFTKIRQEAKINSYL